jgi:plastocyanin
VLRPTPSFRRPPGVRATVRVTRACGAALNAGLNAALGAALGTAVLTGCGDGGRSSAGRPDAPNAGAAPRTAGPAAAAGAAPASGRTVEVRMLGDAKGYRFEPANVTIHAGDAVRWINVSGGPHNVSFWADSVPAGAAAPLGANMPDPTAPLVGPLLADPNATYVVPFAGVTPGRYPYYCTPHLALGMKATVTVQ